MAIRAKTQLMFQGQAEEAMDLYAEVFAEAEIEDVRRVGPDGPGAPGAFELALLRLGGQTFEIFESPVEHGFAFTPSVSISVQLEDAAEVDRAFARLAEGGQVLMPLDAYPFSPRFGWLADRFGVSWQLAVAVP